MIFVDTSFFFPLLSAHDRDHERVREVFETLRGRRLPNLLLTTNHVVGETLTLARARGDHALAVRAGEYLYSEKIARIHWATPEQERAAFAYFAKHNDKHYSFIDCLSFVVMTPSTSPRRGPWTRTSRTVSSSGRGRARGSERWESAGGVSHGASPVPTGTAACCAARA